MAADDVAMRERAAARKAGTIGGAHGHASSSARVMYEDLVRARAALPAAAHAGAVLRALESSQVVLLAGDTGCGKTTQVPQFILDDAIARGCGGRTRICVTQPRRLAAIGVATRVAAERGEPLGEVGGAAGYVIRGERRAHAGTALLFSTVGVLLRRLAGSDGLGTVTHIVVDEVHERGVDTDFLLAVLRRVLPHRRDVKLLLMSATMDAAAFSSYFAPAVVGGVVPVVQVPGFVHPVRELYLEDIFSSALLTKEEAAYYLPREVIGATGDADAAVAPAAVEADDDDSALSPLQARSAAASAAELSLNPYAFSRCPLNLPLLALLLVRVCHPSRPAARSGPADAVAASPAFAKDNGSVLVFLPGVPEIRRLQRELERAALYDGGDLSHLSVLHLHGQLSGAEQAAVFSRAPPGKRKLVLSTNVAETSLTIDDCTVVVDSLRVKESAYESASATSRLAEAWTSKASARQRRGRAGRVRPGACYRLCPRAWFGAPEPNGRGPASILRAAGTPEVLRSALATLVLQAKAIGLGDAPAFLASLPDPPPRRAVAAAVAQLEDMGALDARSELTPLGAHLAALPLEPRLAKALIFGCLLRCADPLLTLAAALAERSPLRPLGPRDDDAGRITAARAAALHGSGGVASHSDHLAVVRAYALWRAAGVRGGARAQRACADELGLSHDTLHAMTALRDDYASTLAERGFLRRLRLGLVR